MNKARAQRIVRIRRARRVRKALVGSADRPRLSVFRSDKFLSAQLIDDVKGKTVVSGSTRGMKKEKKTKSELAALLGVHIAEKAKAMGIKKVVLDRGRYTYHGRVQALADAMRKEGITL